jgi:general secretion pathway protein K
MKPQRGVALIVALLVVALAAVLIAGLLDRGELAQARTRNALREQQAQSYALGLEAYAAKVLMDDQAQGNGVDAADSPWAMPLPPTPVPGGQISAVMTDLDGRFNLNNLDPDNPSAAVWFEKFQWLLGALKLDPKLADNVKAWIDSSTSAGAVSDAYYLAQPIPYRAAHRGFSHVSELRLVQGVDGDVYTTLAPYVSALPVGTTINVNTASVPVLMTLATGLTPEMVQPIWQHGHAHFQNVTDATSAQPALHMIDCRPSCYSTQSSYFLARGQITLDDLPFEFESLIERRAGGSAGGVRVLQRSRGSD